MTITQEYNSPYWIMAILQLIEDVFSKTSLQYMSPLLIMMLALIGRMISFGLARWTRKPGTTPTHIFSCTTQCDHPR
jgi:hypothetical protein